MRVRWRGLELPSKVIKDTSVSTVTYGKFVIEPFERGFGTTIGNSLRRVLLSSLEGSAVTSVKITGAPHEFTAIDGVLEDVTDIILNIKSLVLRMEGDEPKTIRVYRDTTGAVKAGDIETDGTVEILNPDLVLATLTADVKFEMEMVVEKGRGYIPASERMADKEKELGRIYLDALFSPVTRVRYQTEETRVGQRTNYDRLILEIWTKGTEEYGAVVSPEMALVEAGKILRKHLNPLVEYAEPSEETAIIEIEEEQPPEAEAQIDEELREKLKMNIHDLDLSVRALNCLESANITTVADLVKMTETDLLKVRSFGKTSLREVKRKLADLGLSLGMDIPEGGEQSGQLTPDEG